MEYRYIGRSGLRVSAVGMGTMTFGSICDQKSSLQIMDAAYDSGVTFYDTAEIYPIPPNAATLGVTEAIVGEWLKTKPRESVVVATKVAGAAAGWYQSPVRYGMAAVDAFHIRKAVEGSLKRLKTDYIDLYQVHWPDPIVPIEHTMAALDSLVKDGLVRYVGISNETAYGLTRAIYTSRQKGLVAYESIQNNFSLLNRRFLDEIAAVCRGEKISLLPYSPMAGGVLSGKYNANADISNFRYGRYRAHSDARIRAQADRFLNDRTLASTTEYIKLAAGWGMSAATLAVAFSKQFDFVASTIVGATDILQLKESLAAADIKLSDEQMAQCDAVHMRNLYPMG